MSFTQGEDKNLRPVGDSHPRLGPSLLRAAGYASLRNTAAVQPEFLRMRGCFLVWNGYFSKVAPPSDGTSK
jgi:hypothetical protein